MKLSVILEAVDRLTKPVNEIARRVGRLNSEMGFGKIIAAGQKLGSAFGNVAKEAREAAMRVTAAVGVIGGGLFALIKSAADAGDAANDMSQKIGLSATSFQELGYAAKMNGSSPEELADGLRVLNKQVVDAATGNQTMATNFRRLGVTLKDTNGKLKPTDQIFAEIADKFAKMPDGAKKSALAMAIFGDAGVKLIQMMNGGAKGLAAWKDEAHRFGAVLSDEAVGAAGDFNDSLDRLVTSAYGVRNAIATKLLPVLTPLIGRMTDWISANRELIATRVSDFIEAIPGVVDRATSAVQDLYQKLTPLINILQRLVQWLGPVNAALAAIAVVAGGKLLIALAQLTLAFGGFGKAIAATTVRLAAFALAPLIETATAFFSALRFGIGIVEAFNIALAANPIGLVITAIAALAAAVYLIYANWDKIGPWFDKLWSGIKDTFNGFVEWLEKSFVDGILKAFRAISDFITPIITKLQSAIDLGKSVFGSITGGGSAAPAVAHGRGAGSLGAANVRTASGVARLDASGTIRVDVMDNRVQVKARSDDNRMDYRVDNGRVMYDR